MDAREQRGLIIAATCRLNRLPDGTWLVPSQTKRDGGLYRVNLHAKTCTAPITRRAVILANTSTPRLSSISGMFSRTAR